MTTTSEPETATDFAKQIIEGPGGMNDFERYEIVVFHNSERVAAAVWTLRCLANPECEWSQEVIDHILAVRERKRKGV